MQPSDTVQWRILDAAVTVPTSMIAITAFYGIWTGLDFMFASTDTFPWGLALNASYCCVSNFQ